MRQSVRLFDELDPDNREHLEILEKLEPNDRASVVFGKVSFYCEILSNKAILRLITLFSYPNHTEWVSDLFKLQALVNRYHACKYQTDILKEKARLKELMQ